MTLLSKPCGRGGCTGAVLGRWPSSLAQREFCSPRCSALERVRGLAGARAIPLDRNLVGSYLGGSIAGQRRKREAAARAVDRASRFVPPTLLERLTPLQRAQLFAVLARVDHAGYRRGLITAGARSRRAKRKAA